MKLLTYFTLLVVLFSLSEAAAQCSATITPAGPLTFCQGGSVVLNANTAPGNTYVWKRNTTIVQSGTQSSYTANIAGGYNVQITTSSGCTATSAYVTVTILSNGSGITANGYTGIGCLNGGMNLAAIVASGNTYQWKLNGSNIGGATSSTYSTTTAGNYTCQITNGSCSVLSNVINAQYQTSVTNVFGPTIFCTPGGTSLSTTTSVINGSTTYQWQKNNVDIPGATQWTYDPTTTGDYRCRILSSGYCNGPTFSDNINIQSGVPPQIYVNTVAQGPSSLDLCGYIGTDIWLFDATTNSVWPGGSGITWERNGFPLPPGGNALLNVVQTGYYSAYLTTSCGVSIASPFALRILNPAFPPQISVFGNLPACSPVALYVDDAGPLYNSYQWKFNGVVIPGATQSSYNATQPGDYSCIVSNDCASLESDTRYIELFPEPTNDITTSSTKICAGSTVTLTVPYNYNFNYRWRLNGNIISGATSSTYTASVAGNYDCKVYNNCADTAYTNVIALTPVNPPVAVVSAPIATSLCTGNAVNLAANTASGYIYRWLQNGTPISTTGQAVLPVNASGRYSVIITDANACVDTSESVPVFFGVPTVTVISNASSPVCPSIYVTLSANVTNGIADTYQWKLNGVDIPGKTAATLLVLIQSAGTYSVTVTNPCGTVTSPGFPFTLKPATPASITASGPTGFCPPGNVTLNANTGAGLTYQWYRTYSNYPIPGATGTSIVSDTTGVFWVIVTSTATGCAAASNQIKTSRNGIVATVTPNVLTTACSTLVLTANSAPGFTYQWRKNGSNISGANSQNYNATSSGDYSIALTGTCGTSVSDETDVEIYTGPFLPASTQIYPSSSIGCSGSGLQIGINRFILPPYVHNVSIQWLLNGNPLGPPVIPTSWNEVLYPAVSGNYSMTITNACASQTSNVAAITIHPLPVITISAGGPVTFCNGSNVILTASVPAGNTRQWRRNNQPIPGATAATYTATVSGSYTCIATSVNGCNGISNEIDVTVNGSIPGIQSANNAFYFCRNSTANIFSVAAVAGATSYTWSVPAGGTINSGQGTTSISVSFSGSAVNGNICVFATVPCGNGTSTCMPIRFASTKPGTPASISGSVYPCASTTGKVYYCPTVLNASGYTWIVPANATITSGQGTDRITVDFAPAFVSGTIKVAAFNCKGSSLYRTLKVYGIPVTPVVTGVTVGACPNTSQTYSIASTDGATSWIWYPPQNTSINGQYTSSATINFNSQYVTDTLFVDARNSCGISPKRTLILKTVPNIPGTITGPATVCANQQGVAFSVAAVTGATTYQWDVPFGATVASGQNTNSVTVNFGTNAGNVKVRSGNACGYSNYRKKAVAITCRIMNEAIPADLLAVFPNPASDEVRIVLKSDHDNGVHVRISDISGRMVYEMSVEKYIAGEEIRLDLRSLVSGTYFLKVETEFGKYLEKVVIEK